MNIASKLLTSLFIQNLINDPKLQLLCNLMTSSMTAQCLINTMSFIFKKKAFLCCWSSETLEALWLLKLSLCGVESRMVNVNFSTATTSNNSRCMIFTSAVGNEILMCLPVIFTLNLRSLASLSCRVFSWLEVSSATWVRHCCSFSWKTKMQF